MRADDGMSGAVPGTEAELDRTIAILRRYRKLMESQRQGLQEYLGLLDARDRAVAEGRLEFLEEYARREQQVIQGIVSLQKCLEPLAEMYVRAVPGGSPDMDELAEGLERLRCKALARNGESLTMLRGHADRLRKELDGLRARRVPAGSPVASLMVDLEA